MAARRARKKKEGPGRLSQIKSAYTMTRKTDPRIGLILLGIFLGVLVVFVALGLVARAAHPVGILGLTVAALAVTVVFGRRAERSAYKQVEGQPGAALSAL